MLKNYTEGEFYLFLNLPSSDASPCYMMGLIFITITKSLLIAKPNYWQSQPAFLSGAERLPRGLSFLSPVCGSGNRVLPDFPPGPPDILWLWTSFPFSEHRLRSSRCVGPRGEKKKTYIMTRTTPGSQHTQPKGDTCTSASKRAVW